MIKKNFVYRYYLISISIGPFYSLTNTRAYKLPKFFVPYFIGFLYFILILLTGFWGIGILYRFKGVRNSLEAIYINLSGGEDISQKVYENNYDDRTNYVFKNLLRKTTDKISKDEIDIILEIQDFYLETHEFPFSDENINFIIINLGKVDIHRIRKDEIEDVFDAIKLYNKQLDTTPCIPEGQEFVQF